jgi:hypothetical protein
MLEAIAAYIARHKIKCANAQPGNVRLRTKFSAGSRKRDFAVSPQSPMAFLWQSRRMTGITQSALRKWGA